MRLSTILLVDLLYLSRLVSATTDPLNYRNITGYASPQSSNVLTALDFIRSRSDLSTLAEKIDELGGFAEAFGTDPSWKFTFFAPNNDAFASYTGTYFDVFENSPYEKLEILKRILEILIEYRKGKWWLGNTILHHYVPNSEIESTSFNETMQRFQVKNPPFRMMRLVIQSAFS
jgi:hypothetical protein